MNNYRFIWESNQCRVQRKVLFFWMTVCYQDTVQDALQFIRRAYIKDISSY